MLADPKVVTETLKRLCAVSLEKDNALVDEHGSACAWWYLACARIILQHYIIPTDTKFGLCKYADQLCLMEN